VLAGLHIGDGDQQERVLGQEDKRLMGLVQAGLAIAEVEAAASRDLIDHGEECRLAIALKKIL
jgi:hypothetical protein